MLDKLTNLTVIPVGYGEHCNFTLRVDTKSEQLELKNIRSYLNLSGKIFHWSWTTKTFMEMRWQIPSLDQIRRGDDRKQF